MLRLALLAALTLYFCAGCADDANAQCQGGQCAIGSGVQTYDVPSGYAEAYAGVRVGHAATAPVRFFRQAQPVRRLLGARPRLLGRCGRRCG